MKQEILFCAFLLLLFSEKAYSTHNRAGEIRVEQIGGCNSLSLKATIITWTKASSTAADRDTLEICWGDGTCQKLARSNGGGSGTILPNDIKYNTYEGFHTYAAQATYTISMTDPNRIAGILNVNPPSSDNIPFHIETIYKFQDPQFGGCNSTPILYQPPIDIGCIGRTFKHNPNASDPEGDSLSYQLVVPLQAPGTPVPNYSFPNQIGVGGANIFQLNAQSGDLIWIYPQVAGEYNVAIAIISWRNGQPIDTTIRDMQISIGTCDNYPPDVDTEEADYCVIAGQTLEFGVTGTDPDVLDSVRLSALGAPFNVAVSPAQFITPPGFQAQVATGIFRWQTTCEHILKTPYPVVFKAEENQDTSLVDLQTVRIKVVGPPPEDVQAVANPGEVFISWQKPYICEDVTDDYFYGFSVWRREGSNPFPLDTCTPGLDGKGYTQLIPLTIDMQNGRYFYKDNTIESGKTYCYRILAKFAKLSVGGYPYNLVESLPSEEVCSQLPRNIPIITNVSVEETSNTTGKILVKWTKPIAADLDTLLNPPPYRYEVLRAPGITSSGFQPVPGASFVANSFATANDTSLIDNGLNSEGTAYSYKIAFYVNNSNTPLGETPPASSVRLTVGATDRRTNLSWQHQVPWGNYGYAIFRQNDITGLFDSIAYTPNLVYVDTGLINGKQYCYKIKSFGTYSIAGLSAPLINYSQEDCGIPLDTVPPCPPNLTVKNICNGLPPSGQEPPYLNLLTWDNPNNFCLFTGDAVSYTVYYSTDSTTAAQVIQSIPDAEVTQYEHFLAEGLAGCYTVTATDSIGNESLPSNKVCVDNCPKYDLPNVFTPNGDNQNDLYTPFADWRFISRVEMQIFNQWGNLVFTTNDPAINWRGTNQQGQELAEATYFYICKVYESKLQGEVLRSPVLQGYIELLRGK